MKLYIGKKCFSYYQLEQQGRESLNEEMTKLVNSWTYKSDLQAIALKALMIMPSLLLQKASLNSKSKENSETLKRGLSLRKNWATRSTHVAGENNSRQTTK